MADFLQKTGANTGLAHEFKDIFELGGVPAFNQFYYFGIFIWKYLYKGFYSAWHKIPAPTVADPYAVRRMERMDMAKACSAELAGLIWNEQCEVHVSQDGDTEDLHPLEDFIHDVLDDNNFMEKMQEHVEQSLALGGGALKAWADGQHTEEGNLIPGTEKINIGYCMADQFVPTAWDNAKVTEGVFISRQAKDGYYYTRLEWHKWDGTTYWVSNELFRTEMRKGGDGEPQDILGFRYPLQTIYPFLSEATPLQGLSTSLFTYYRTAIANNLDDNSPLGVSIYANALSTLHALDVCYDSFIREFRLGRRRIIVPTQCLRTVIDPVTGTPRRYFDATDEAYEAFATDDPEALKIQDNTVSLRVDEHVSAINAFLSILCLQLGFSAGTFTFDRATGLKTATEVISENSKTYKTIKSHQRQIKKAIKDLIESILAVASVYDIHHNGISIRSLVEKGYECKVTFDDSILQDRQTNVNEGILLMSNGVMSKLTYMTKMLGMTEEEAEIELKRIADESAVTGSMLDLLEVGGAE